MRNCTVLPCFMSTSEDNANSTMKHFGGDSPRAQDAMNVILILASAIVIASILLMAIRSPSLFMELCCFPWLQPPTEDEPIELDHGPVARKAGLSKLTRDDRRLILNQILTGTPYTSDMMASRENNKALRMEEEIVTSTSTAEISSREDDEEQEGAKERKHTITTDNMIEACYGDSSLNSKPQGRTCAICINDYEQGDLVVNGASCTHMFHKSCILLWLEKNDHCPYCREEMISPSQMKAAAKKILVSPWTTSSRTMAVQTNGPSPEHISLQIEGSYDVDDAHSMGESFEE